jgi:ferredoxin-type protein NapF
VTKALTRRAVFARFRSGRAQLRPPWSRPEAAFTEACTQCGKCIAACPTRIITKGHAGYPIVDFANAACTFCGACADVCKDACFDRGAGAPWSLKAKISSACVEPKGVACRMCADVCEPRAIRFRPKLGGGSTPTVGLDDCTGCGACLVPCPVNAITIAMPETEETVA